MANCSPHLWISVASLQQHVQGILQTTAQVRGAARAEQRAQLEGGGGSLLVDVRQQVFVLLCAQDELGVVVIEVHLFGDEENTFVILELTWNTYGMQDVITAEFVTFFPQCYSVHSFLSEQTDLTDNYPGVLMGVESTRQ